QLRHELQLLLLCCVLTGSAPLAVFPRLRGRCFDALQQCWLMALYAWLCYAAYMELVQSSLNISELEHKFYYLESLTYLIHVPCIMLLAVRWKHSIGGVFERIARFDLASGYSAQQRSSVGSFVNCQLLLVLLLAGSCVPIACFFCRLNPWKTLINLSTYVLPNVLSGISLIPYYTLLQGAARRLHSVTQALRAGSVERAALQQLRWQHAQLLQFVRALNRTFGVSILCVYVSSFINFNTNLFLAYKNVADPDVEEWAWWTYVILWIGMHFGKMFIILYFNNSVQREQTSCLSLLCALRADSVELMETVNHFVLQLQMNVRAHVACGLIVLDYKYITAIMMATTNVFIFFLQYDITYQALARPANETKLL
ncbi:hypothetical protein KR222_008045, partial [Zaprionus bogoriensis]